MNRPLVDDPPVRGGRPRSQAADDAILAATLDILRDQGYGGLTVIAVIERAGVSSATLYRRWATKQDLVLAALDTVRSEPTSTDTGSLEGDLRALMRSVRSAIERGWAVLSDAVAFEAKRNPDLQAALNRRFLVPRTEQLAAILNRAKLRGELSAIPSPEVGLSLIVGPLHHRAVVLGLPLSDAFVAKAVRHAVVGLRAACAKPMLH